MKKTFKKLLLSMVSFAVVFMMSTLMVYADLIDPSVEIAKRTATPVVIGVIIVIIVAVILIRKLKKR